MNPLEEEDRPPTPLRLVCVAGPGGNPPVPLPPSPPVWVSYAVVVAAVLLIAGMAMVLL